MSRRVSLAGGLALLAMSAVFLPLVPGLALTAAPLLRCEIWLALWQDAQWPQAAVVMLVSTLISVCGAASLTLLIICGLWPGPRWQRYVRRLPALLAFPHVAFASGLLFLFTDNGWLMRLIPATFPAESTGIGLGIMLALKETWFLLWFASTQLNQHELEQQLVIAQTLGYGPLHGRLIVLVPQLLPRLGWALVAIVAYSLSVVDVAVILGPTNPPSLAVLAWQWMNDGDPQQQAMGVALSLVMLIVLTGFILSGKLLWLAIRSRLKHFSGFRHRTDIRHFSTGVAAGMSLTGVASLLMLASWSLAQGWFYPALLPDEVTLSGWLAASYEPLVTALLLALASSFLAVVCILFWLEGCSRRFDICILLPLLLPALPLAAGQYQVLLNIRQDGTWQAVVWSHLLWVIPYTLLVVKPAWLRLDPRYASVARTFGWSDWKILWCVKAPLLLRPLLAALAVGFSVSVAQYLPTLYAGAGRITTVTTEAVALSSGGDPQQMAIQSLLQMALPAGMFIVTLQLSRLICHYRLGLR